MDFDFREAFGRILAGYPSESRKPAESMSEEVKRAFDDIAEHLQIRLGVRASEKYKVEHNVEFLDTRRKFPQWNFEPEGRSQSVRNPTLYVVILIPPSAESIALLLTDVRGQGSGPSDEVKRKQREVLRNRFGQQHQWAWEFESGTPRLGSTDDDGGYTGQITEGALFYRVYDRLDLPENDELIQTLDKLLRLRETYEEFWSDEADLLEETGRNRGGNEDEGPLGGEIAPTEGQDEEAEEEEMWVGEPSETRNLILYGPPGTGKTYGTARRAVELCGEIDAGEEISDRELKRKYRRLRSQGRIEFVTFHQSFGYEEFVEGIRPVMDEAETSGGDEDNVSYTCEKGVFQRVSLLAASEGLDLGEDDREFEARWRALQRQAEGEGLTGKSISGVTYRVDTRTDDAFQLVRMTEGEESVATPTKYDVRKKSLKRWWNKRNELGTDYQNLTQSKVQSVLSNENMFTRNWVMYRLLRKVEPEREKGVEVEELTKSQRISRAETYLDEREEERSANAFGEFERAKPHVLIIDEINRGNISKILGELITLLEPSKRLTREDELLVKLPYSKQTFGVPPNLHVLGTMNTADRSIALLDAALRRRFEYEERMPDPGVVVEVLMERLEVERLEELPEEESYLVNLLPALLETINDRIEYLYDRDHQIGHSYFLECESLVDLREAFVDRIIPLLQEYFYGAWDELCLVLGCPYDRTGSPSRSRQDGHVFEDEGSGYAAPLIRSEVLDEAEVLRVDRSDYEDEVSWAVNSEFEEETGREELKRYFEAVLPQERVAEVREGEVAEAYADTNEREGLGAEASAVEEVE